MTFAISTDIESEFRNIVFGSGSNAAISTAEVDEFLTQTDALINGILKPKYELPITGSNSLEILKKIEIDFVAFRVSKILNLKKSIPLPDKTIVQDLNNGFAYKESKKLLDAIFEGKFVLPDADLLTGSSGLSDFNSANSIEPIWKRDTKQW